MSQTLSGRLTAEQADFYRTQGYLLFDQPVFEPAKFTRLAEHFEQLLSLWTEEVGDRRTPEHMDTPHFYDTALFEWLFDDRVLDIVESLIGPDIALFSSHFLCKPAGVGKQVPWHEDSSYWRGRLDPMEVVTIWLAIDPATPGNGCMRVIPGTHHGGFSEYEQVQDPAKQVFGSQIKAGQFDETTAVDMILKPNQCSLHDGKLIHGSNPNNGTMRRCGYTMRYMPAHVKLTVIEDAPFQVYLARGRDRAGNTCGDPAKKFEPWLKRHEGIYPGSDL